MSFEDDLLEMTDAEIHQLIFDLRKDVLTMQADRDRYVTRTSELESRLAAIRGIAEGSYKA